MKNTIPAVFLSFLLITSCSAPEPVVKPLHVSPEMKKILVVSFRNAAENSGDSQGVRCPLSGKIFVSGEVAPEAENLLSGHLKKILQKYDQFIFITPDQVQGIRSENGTGADERQMLAETGRKLGADAVLAGHIYRYRDRVGAKLSVESPASVAFDLHFLRVADGRVIWSNHFDETQKALTDDLFRLSSFLQRDGQWITAEQMALAGLENIMEAFQLP